MGVLMGEENTKIEKKTDLTHLSETETEEYNNRYMNGYKYNDDIFHEDGVGDKLSYNGREKAGSSGTDGSQGGDHGYEDEPLALNPNNFGDSNSTEMPIVGLKHVSQTTPTTSTTPKTQTTQTTPTTSTTSTTQTTPATKKNTTLDGLLAVDPNNVAYSNFTETPFELTNTQAMETTTMK
jgi:hypothetical protein